MATKPTEPMEINGVNVRELQHRIEVFEKDENRARCVFRLSNEWVDGGHNRSTISTFTAGGEKITHSIPMELEADEPPVLLGQDLAPNPVEHLLNALAACVTTTLVYHAAARGIRIDSVESEVSGELDLRGFLGIGDDVRPGYESIHIDFHIDADVPDDQLHELAELCQMSPVYDSLTRGVDIRVHADRSK